jgi:AcrR family transcriptional regulator
MAVAERIGSTAVQELGRRERKKLATRLALEEAAMRLFTEKGFDGTTVEEIADAADVSARTFFRYFATKDEVLFGDHEPRLEAMRQLLDARPADEPVMASLEALLRALGDLLVEHRERALVQSEVSRTRVQILGLFRQHQEEMNEVIAAFVATRLSSEGQVRMRARVVASAAMGAYLAAGAEWVRSGGTEDMDRLMDEALESLRTVLVAEPA